MKDIDEKIAILKQSIASSDDTDYTIRLKSTLNMLLNKKNGLLEKTKPKYIDPDIYKKEKKYRIYKLKSNGITIYVGITSKSLKERLDSGYKWLNIEDIKIELIEETNDFKREEYWINKYTEWGYKLYNSNTPSNIERGIIKKLGRKEYNKQYGIIYRKKIKIKIK